MRVNVETNLRESGVDWLGKIPIDWQVHLFSQTIDRISTGLNPRENFSLNEGGHLYYVTIANFKANKLMLDEACDRIDERAWTLIQERSRLQVGDVLFASIAREGQAYIVREFPENWNINESVFSIRPNKRYFDSEYLYYLLTCSRFFDRLLLEATGSTFKSIKQEMLRNALVVVPSLSVQRQIVAYLNDKTAVIDSRVTVLEQKLAAYKRLKASVINRAVTRGLDLKAKLKDSGEDWIGKVPAGWTVGRFKDIAAVRANLVAPDQYMDYPQIAPENIEKGTGKLLGYGTVRESGIISGNHLFRKGQIIYSKIRPILNKLVIANFDGLCSADMYPVDVLGDLRFVFYQMLSPVFVNQVAAIVGMRVKMPKINQEELSAIGMVIPSLAEQRAIADYLDAECAKIDKMAELVTREVELYKKLKRSLINEVVTGKREVA